MRNDVQDVLEKLGDLDFTNVICILIDSRSYRFEQAEKLQEEYLKFLALALTYADKGNPIIAPYPVNDFWEAHIVYSKSYYEMCKRFNSYMHHKLFERNEFLNVAYARTLEKYEDIFGKCPQAEFWPPTLNEVPSSVWGIDGGK